MPMATRRDLIDPADPAHMTPQQPLGEVAAILAKGVIRMRESRRATAIPNVQRCRGRHGASPSRRATACMPENSPESGETRLELSRRSGPDGQCG
jgi:hypothetical protein